MKLGRRIKAARVAQGLSQEGLGDLVHKSRSLIAQIEKRNTGNPETIQAIEKVLKVNLSEEGVAAEPAPDYKKKDERIKELEEENTGLKIALAEAKDKIIKLQEQIIEGKKPNADKAKKKQK